MEKVFPPCNAIRLGIILPIVKILDRWERTFSLEYNITFERSGH